MLMVISVVPIGSMPKHCANEVRPNTRPRNAPPPGPSRIAPMTTGTGINVMENGPRRR